MRRRRFTRNRQRLRRPDQEAPGYNAPAPRADRQMEQLGPYYRGGPVHDLVAPACAQSPARQKEELAAPAVTAPEAQGQALDRLDTTAGARPEQAVTQSTSEPLAALEGRGQPSHEVNFAGPGSLRLRGRTDINFDGGAFHTENVTAGRGANCNGCSGKSCVHVTGTLIADYLVTTTVTLPSVSDFPQLTPCQQRRVQDAITNVLAPHEQQHVNAVQPYNGTTRRAFDLTLCHNQFDAAIQPMFQQEESARRQAAQAASDALDPFFFDVDLNCSEPHASITAPSAAGAAAVPPEPREDQPV